MIARPLLFLLSLASLAWAQAPVVPQPFGEAQARTFPYAMAGKLTFAQGRDRFQGSAVVVRPQGVLTAAHNLWDEERGFSTELYFRRAFYGVPAVPDRAPSRVYVLAGYREKARKLGPTDVRTFSDDLGALVFALPLAGGSHAGWWANAVALARPQPGLALGYGAETHSGLELLGVAPAAGYVRLVESFMVNESVNFEAGMSGGPVFAPLPQGGLAVAGIVVAGATDAASGGIRALDEKAAAFIRTYLR